jgi:2-polyprenyl-3-methyl-5-hydroxy-6-metoxy-1,4-benzoquinol methylase
MRDTRKPNKRERAQDFYGALFTKHPYWSTSYPNADEAGRWSSISRFLSRIAQTTQCNEGGLRILDVGCGRGWLTRLSSIYGVCDGIEPVKDSISLARKYFPELRFVVSDLASFPAVADFKPYHVAIASEIIEHVVDKKEFVGDLTKCLVPEGHAIITTPRGELFKKWQRLGYGKQPIEEWLTEKDLCMLFQSHNFQPIMRDRVYIDLPRMSFMNRLCASRRLVELLTPLRLAWFLKGLQYAAGFYQSWWFRLGTKTG